MKRILLIAIVTILLTGCDEKLKIYQTGDMPLRQLVKQTTKEKTVTGSYFLIAGNINSKETESAKIKMYVLASGVYNFIEFDLQTVKIQINNSVENPYLYIKYAYTKKLSDFELVNQSNNWFYFNNPTVVLVCAEKYLPEQLLPINL